MSRYDHEENHMVIDSNYPYEDYEERDEDEYDYEDEEPEEDQ